MLTLLVTGCGSTQIGSIRAMNDTVTPEMQKLAGVTADCTHPACDPVVKQAAIAISAYDAAVNNEE
jgi:hypothetical protein